MSQLQPGGVRVGYAYDDLNRVIGQTGTGADAPTAARTFGYDDAGRLTSLSVPGGTDSISYDDRGLPLSIAGPADASTYTYNSDGLLTARADAAGTTSFTYDTAGRFKTASNSATNLDLSVAYNNLNQPSTVTYGVNNQLRTFTYDPLHRLKTDTLKTFSGSTILGAIAYDYDANGNETSKVTTGFAGASTNTYTYDLADRLSSWTSGSAVTNYAYDASGNRIQNGAKTFSYDQRNQLTGQSGGTSYAYTARGTLTQTSGPGGVYSTTADAYGQVISQQAAGGTSTNQYDAAGRVVRAGFRYSGMGNTLAQDATTTYTRGPGGEVLGAGAGAGAHSMYVWTDQHTDVVGQFTATGTSLAGSASYDPLGAVLATVGMVGNLGYQSEWTDTTTSRVNMLARWYNTDTGQFDTRDTQSNSPVPASIAANRFQYGDGSPLLNTDPSGHSLWGKIKSSASAVAHVVSNPVAAVQATYNYVASGQAWNDVKAATNYVVDKTKQATKVVVKATSTWVKNKVNTVRDKYNQARECINGGVSKCVKETAKKAVKAVGETVKNTYNAIKEDPWKFVATAAVGILATVAVGALCATGVGCLILAGAVAGAMQAGAGYMVDVARGDAEFSWHGLADTMIEGGLDGALSAGVSKFTGGATKYLTKGAGGAAGGLKKMIGGGNKEVNAPKHTGGGGGERPSGNRRSTENADAGGGGTSGEYQGKHRDDTCEHSFDPATLVLMADGTAKAIAEVQSGDQVVATDPETGTTEAKTVETQHRNHDTDLTDVTVTTHDDGKDTEAVLHTTWHHPFWNETEHDWVYAQDLKTGDLLHTDTGALVEVKTVHNTVGTADMRDLTIEQIHTYYVIAGNAPVLVHNCGADNDHIVYRALADGEDPSVGLFARDPSAVDVTPLSHVAGKKATPWISASKCRCVAADKYDAGHGYVAIDTRLVGRVEDISDGPFPTSRRHASYARRDKEVLLFQHVPAEAIVGVWGRS